MNRDDSIEALGFGDPESADLESAIDDARGGELLRCLLGSTRPDLSTRNAPASLPCAIVGQIAALIEQGRVPLVVYPGMPGAAALRARSTIDLDRRHLGHRVVLNFEDGDPTRPIVMGRLVHEHARVPPGPPAAVELDADDQTLVISVDRRLVLRCGRASIMLEADGRVIVRGESIISQAVGANHVCGGSVQLN
jgi:hypothetical protein